MIGTLAGQNKEKGSLTLEMAIWTGLIVIGLVFFTKAYQRSYQGFKKAEALQNQSLRL